LRAIRTAVLLAALLTLVGGPATVHAAGPGVTFYPKDRRPVELPGSLISAAADVPRRTYTLPTGRKTLTGVSIRRLLVGNRINPDAVRFLQIVNDYGGSIVLKRADFGGAFVSDDGRTTRFIRTTGGGEVRQSIETTGASGPLEISVDGGSDIPIKATARPSRVKVGETVVLEAHVRYSEPGTRYSYEWEYGDGPVAGARIEHAFDRAGAVVAVVSVRSLDPNCATRCGGVERVSVQVGEAQPQPEAPDPTPGGTQGDPQAPGSASGTGGGGQGGSGGDAAGTGSGSATAPKPKPKSKPAPPPKPPFGTTISGVLINDPGEAVQKLPTGEAAGAPKGLRATRGGDDGTSPQLGLGGLLALAVMTLGALRERRGVRLRLA